MSVVLSSVDRRTKIGTLYLDVLLTEEIKFESEVTKFPVEDGTVITDHITQGNKTISLSGLFATADVSGGFSNAASFGFGVDKSNKLVDIVEAFESIYKARAIVTISTGQMLHEDYAFSSINLSRSAGDGNGNWLNMRADLTKVIKVKLKTADVPAAETTAPSTAGRAGETNKPAGRSTPSSSNANASSYGPQQNASDTTTAKRLGMAARPSLDQISQQVQSAIQGITGR